MRGQNMTSGKTRRRMFYYVCPIKLNESAAACENRSHRAEPLERYVAESVSALLSDPSEIVSPIEEKIKAEKKIARNPEREIATLSRQLETLAIKRSRYLDLYAEGVVATNEELSEKIAAVDSDIQSTQRAIESARDRRESIEALEYQRGAVLLVYSVFAKQNLLNFSPPERRALYERLGLRVRVSKDLPPEIELTFDTRVLPSVEEAQKAIEKVKEKASGEDLTSARARP